MNPSFKRKLLRPFIEIAKATRKLKKELKTPEEIIDMRDKIHIELMTAQKKGMKQVADILEIKEKILNWVLKINE
jgi:hypothetical protein